jgi:hypothetical protein
VLSLAPVTAGVSLMSRVTTVASDATSKLPISI